MRHTLAPAGSPMVWFGKHSVAYVIYVPAAVAGLLIPYAWAFASGAAEQSAAGAMAGLSPAPSQAAEGQNGHLQNGAMQNGTMQNGGLQNGEVKDHVPDALLGDLMAAQLQRRRLPEALLGEGQSCRSSAEGQRRPQGQDWREGIYEEGRSLHACLCLCLLFWACPVLTCFGRLSCTQQHCPSLTLQWGSHLRQGYARGCCSSALRLLTGCCRVFNAQAGRWLAACWLAR